METLLTITTTHNTEQRPFHARCLPLQTHICDGCLKWVMTLLLRVMCHLLRQLHRAHIGSKYWICLVRVFFFCYDVHMLIAAGSYTTTIEHIAEDVFVTTALVRHGLVPCAPFSPTTAFTIQVLEFYRVSHNHSPSLSIHTFIKTLCDLHSAPFKPYISRQFSICYDLYL